MDDSPTIMDVFQKIRQKEAHECFLLLIFLYRLCILLREQRDEVQMIGRLSLGGGNVGQEATVSRIEFFFAGDEKPEY